MNSPAALVCGDLTFCGRFVVGTTRTVQKQRRNDVYYFFREEKKSPLYYHVSLSSDV